MKRSKLLGFALLAISLGLSGCGEIETPVEPTPDPKPEEVKSEITIDADIITNGLSFTSDKGEKSISFTTNEDWTLSIAATPSDDTWCTASATSGAKGNANVKFTVTENTSYDDRSVSVTIKSGTASKTFTITQKYTDALLLTTNKYELSQEGGTIEIEVKANIDYEMEIAESAKDWITETSTRALTAYKHAFTIATNEEVEKREGEIYFKSGDKVEIVKIYQEGAGAIILLSQNEYIVSDAGETISVDIRSNIEYSVQMPNVDWITDEPSTRGMSSHTLKYAIVPNEEYDIRSAEIIFYDKNSELKDTLKIVQVQKDAIIVAQNEYTVESDGGNLEFEVNTNVDFEVSTSVDWIKQGVVTRGLESKPLYFLIEGNTKDEPREGIITISSGELKQEIKVIQKRKIRFSISNTERHFTSEGQNFNIEIYSDGNFFVTMPDVDWLKETNSSGVRRWFKISTNDTYNQREADIIFTHKESNEAITVRIIQAQNDAIVISQRSYDVKSEGETIEIKLSANIDFEIKMPEVDWISRVDTRALQEHVLYLNVRANGYQYRSAKILFKGLGSELVDSVIINQSANIKCITMEEAGSMKKLLGDDYLNISCLKVIGPINGDDIYYLRKMLAGSDFSEVDWGCLTSLDLSEARIVEGGEWYFKNQYTISNTIGDYMFYECYNLQTIKLPDNITSIGSHAFSKTALASIDIPKSVSYLGGSAFTYCSNLKTATINSGEISICDYAFNSSGLISISIGDGNTTIGSYAFDKCRDLESVTIGDGGTSIASRAFYDCGLSTISIGNGEISIGSRAFYNCGLLESITFGSSKIKIEEYVFVHCNSLQSVYINNLSDWCNISFPDSFSNPLSRGAKLYLNNIEVTELTIPQDITEIKSYAFSGCQSITRIHIHEKVLIIQQGAFSGCDSLTLVEVPDSVSVIYDNAFSNCSSLKSVTIGNGGTRIGEKAFYNCDALTTVAIGSGNNFIDYYAFNDCDALTTVTIDSGEKTEIRKTAFLSCESIKDFYSYSEIPPSINTYHTEIKGDTFNHYEEQTTLHVPTRCGSKYKSSDWGKYFKNIKEID